MQNLRTKRTRGRLKQHLSRPRLSVFRSNKFIYAQVIDDAKGITLAAAHGKNPVEVGEKVGRGESS